MGLIYYRRALGKPVDPNKTAGYYFGRFNSAKIYYAAKRAGQVAELVGADADTFKVINYEYAKDKSRVYYKSIALEADPATFCLDEEGLPKDFNSVFFIEEQPDGQVVSRIIEDAAPVTYTKIKNHRNWGKDHAHFFFKNKKLDVDFKSFEFINSVWAKDKDRVYQLNEEGVTAIGANVSNLRVLNEHFLCDKQHVYFSGEMPGEEELVGIQLNRFAYELSSPIEFLSECHLRNNNKIYFCGLETEIDSSSFQPFLVRGKLFHGFSKDQYFVYKYNKKLTHIDVQSFRVIGEVMRDKHNRYDVDGDIFGSPFQG